VTQSCWARILNMKSATWMVLTIGIACCELWPLNARRMIVPSYQQLLDRSDLVVIATPITRTKDTAEASYLPRIFRQDANGVQSQIVLRSSGQFKA